mgnify:CR=1 FL=1
MKLSINNAISRMDASRSRVVEIVDVYVYFGEMKYRLRGLTCAHVGDDEPP